MGRSGIAISSHEEKSVKDVQRNAKMTQIVERDAERRLYHIYYNFCLPHASVRQPLPQPVPTNGTGTATQWRPCTPTMAAGLTNRVWTLREVLMFRVPPWPQPQQL